jgi:hypothetical protein
MYNIMKMLFNSVLANLYLRYTMLILYIHIKLQDTGFLFMKATVFVVYFQISIQYLEVICVYIHVAVGNSGFQQRL